jgi:hypothetical protein
VGWNVDGGIGGDEMSGDRDIKGRQTDGSLSLADVMDAFRNDFYKLARDGNRNISLEELQQDMNDKNLSSKDRRAASWLSSHFAAIADKSGDEWFWERAHISPADQSKLLSTFKEFETDLGKVRKLEQLMQKMFGKSKAVIDSSGLEAAKSKFKDAESAGSIEWAKEHLADFGHVTKSSMHYIGHSSFLVPVWKHTYGLSSDDISKVEEQVRSLDKYSVFRASVQPPSGPK